VGGPECQERGKGREPPQGSKIQIGGKKRILFTGKLRGAGGGGGRCRGTDRWKSKKNTESRLRPPLSEQRKRVSKA